MKNLVQHMRAGRIKRPREAHMRIPVKLIDNELSGYDKFVDDYNRLETNFHQFREMRDAEIATLKTEIKRVTKQLDEVKAELAKLKAAPSEEPCPKGWDSTETPI